MRKKIYSIPISRWRLNFTEKWKIPYIFDFLTTTFSDSRVPQKNPSILSYLDNSVCRNWNFSCDTERGENRETRARARDMSIARFCHCSSGRGARLLTSGYTEILLLSRWKKVGETAKSAIWIPLRGVTIPRGTMSHEATRRNAAHANAASGRRGRLVCRAARNFH